ncbi:MAG: hypothetical protein O7C61_12495 [SAR324 cluster bacterium]|nr:hypothetical protein [SAR324 cluster bacterium]
MLRAVFRMRVWARETQSSEPGFALAAFATTQPYKDRAVLNGLLELLRKAG